MAMTSPNMAMLAREVLAPSDIINCPAIGGTNRGYHSVCTELSK